jgi:hypothetical protein
MAKQRSTFGKIQREQEKRAKAQAKRDKRAQRGTADEANASDETPQATAADQGAILDALARLYQEYENGELETDDFELRRDELRAQIDLD